MRPGFSGKAFSGSPLGPDAFIGVCGQLWPTAYGDANLHEGGGHGLHRTGRTGIRKLRVRSFARMLLRLFDVLMTNQIRYCSNCSLPIPAGSDRCPTCRWETRPQEMSGVAVEGREDSRFVPWTVGQISIGLFLFVGVLYAAAFMARAVGPLYPQHETALETWVAVHLLAAGIALLVWFMGVRQSPSPLRALGLVRPRLSVPWSALLTLATLGFSIVATFLYGLIVESLDLQALRPPEIRTEAIFPGVGFLVTFQALAVVTPVSEEVLFRGFVLRGLLARIGSGPAIVSTALVFSALHLDAGTIIPIFLTGLALGWLHVKTGSLWPCIAAHAGQNAIALLAVKAGL